MNIFRAARNMMKQRPLVSNMLSFGGMYVAAEFSQQTIILHLDKSDKGYNWPAIGRYVVMGTFLYSPLLYYWYRYLDGVLPSKAIKVAIKKTLIDQAVSSSILLVVFYVGMSIMERKEDIFEEVKQKWLPSYKLSCCFWLPTQAINFFLVPAYLRVVFVGSASFVWVNVLCILKRMQMKKEA
ncbi:mpv17-like protein [Centruroides vittatus]|uniref:mpv17-like protein n=1 Tax=Centruroides vittatus TaxID=120091 RepID=UPI0035102462